MLFEGLLLPAGFKRDRFRWVPPSAMERGSERVAAKREREKNCRKTEPSSLFLISNFSSLCCFPLLSRER